MKGIFDECDFAPLPSLPYLYTQKIGRMDRSQNKTIMKKYTIKEFAEGKKAVKIENEEQWSKLNKVHKLTTKFYNSNLYTNQNTYNGGRQFYIDCGYELLEFSQLDFEDGFVEGKWYKRVEEEGYLYQPEYVYYVKCNSTNKKEKGILNYSERINFGGTHIYYNNYCETSDFIQVDLSEIQQYLPENHPDLIKKDTFVLPEKWYVKITEENRKQLNDWKVNQEYKDNLFVYKNYGYLAEDGAGICTLMMGIPIITFEEFQQYVLKTTKTMEKEIIGYKLVKQEYKEAAIKIATTLDWGIVGKNYDFSTDSIVYKNLKEAGVLDLWFEPVYAIKFKENDWVVPLVESGYSRPAGSHCRTTARAYKVYHVDSKGVRLYEKDNVSTDGNGYLNFKYVRLANPEEIKAAQIQLPIIKDYNGTLNGYIVKYGCTEVNTNCLIDIYDDILSFNVPDPKLKDYDGGNVSIKAVILSNGTSVSLEQIKQIVEYITKK